VTVVSAACAACPVPYKLPASNMPASSLFFCQFMVIGINPSFDENLLKAFHELLL
jgi:hypothetical protein